MKSVLSVICQGKILHPRFYYDFFYLQIRLKLLYIIVAAFNATYIFRLNSLNVCTSRLQPRATPEQRNCNGYRVLNTVFVPQTPAFPTKGQAARIKVFLK